MPFPPPEDLPNPRIEPVSLTPPTLTGGFFTASITWEAQLKHATAKSCQSCPTVQRHRWQPTRLPRPWDSPGKNTGVGCHFLFQCIKVKVKLLSHVRLLATSLTAAYQAPPSMGFSRQEYWSGLPLPSPTSLSTYIYQSIDPSVYIYMVSLNPHGCMHAKLLQSCLTLCNPMDCNP